ncbi:putative mitochondrial protein [Cardamine amara subsp. amara]|uniref:Mitochondrial protein n=1 Tax=Cardamine amara subsp. amara TaxID=228776 RepID=A0ABD1BC02_CARAN
MNIAEKLILLEGIRFAPNQPSVHHLLFADDNLFICKAEVNQCETHKGILKIYGEATGQTINLLKSSITFGGAVEEERKLLLQQKLGIVVEGGAGTYLGLPECFSGSKIQLLDFVKDRLKSRLSGWFARCLSMGGKEILIKVMAMAMPVYAISCFKLTKTIIANLTSVISDFWWNAVEGKQKTHWVSWEKMCMSKEDGGLWFRDLECFNQALLAKQAWRLIQEPDSLFAQVMKSIYYPDADFMEAVLGLRPSYGWRSILYGRELLSQGLSKQIGNGESFQVWTDSWIEDNGWRPPLRKQTYFDLNMSVSDLIDVQRRYWNVEVLQDLFPLEDIQRISRIRPVVGKEDFWTWDHTKSGDYTVKSENWLANQILKEDLIQMAELQPSLNELKEKVWSLPTVPKIKAFLWRATNDTLPVMESLQSRGLDGDIRCQLCGMEGESINHALFTCTVARQTWALSRFSHPREGFDEFSVYSNLYYLYTTGKKRGLPTNIRRLFPWILWRIWKNRNLFLFEGKVFHPLETQKKIEEDAKEWSMAQIVEQEIEENNAVEEEPKTFWEPPPSLWLKCNI